MDWLSITSELEQLLTKATKQHGKVLVNSLLGFGASLYQQGYKEQAIRVWQTGMELSQLSFFLYNQGVAFTELGRYAEAEAMYHQAIEKELNDAAAYNNLAILLRMIG